MSKLLSTDNIVRRLDDISDLIGELPTTNTETPLDDRVWQVIYQQNQMITLLAAKLEGISKRGIAMSRSEKTRELEKEILARQRR